MKKPSGLDCFFYPDEQSQSSSPVGVGVSFLPPARCAPDVMTQSSEVHWRGLSSDADEGEVSAARVVGVGVS